VKTVLTPPFQNPVKGNCNPPKIKGTPYIATGPFGNHNAPKFPKEEDFFKKVKSLKKMRHGFPFNTGNNQDVSLLESSPG